MSVAEREPLVEQIKRASLAARKSAIGKPEGSQESVRAKSLTLLVSNIQSVLKEAQVKSPAMETLDDAAVVAVVKKSLKTVDDALSKGAAGDYAAKLSVERAVLDEFLPKQLTEEEIRKEIKAFREAKGSLEIKDTGAVMKDLNSRFPGRVDGKLVSDLVKEEAK